MFTGIIESVGTVTQIGESGSFVKLSVENPVKFGDVKTGASISINGACLTVLDIDESKNCETYAFAVSRETVSKTNLGLAKTKSYVNLERALLATGRFDGHIVLGHVDTMVKVSGISKKAGGDKVFEFEFDRAYNESFVEKGSVALNGISLTLIEVTKNNFKTVILPFTLEKTNLKYLKIGDMVNCETDILGKYFKKFAAKGSKESNIDIKFLTEHGYAGR